MGEVGQRLPLDERAVVGWPLGKISEKVKEEKGSNTNLVVKETGLGVLKHRVIAAGMRFMFSLWLRE